LNQFRTGSDFDALVKQLGVQALQVFVADYPQFSPIHFYDPASWRNEPQYKGITGGGGGGRGGGRARLADGGTPPGQPPLGGGGVEHAVGGGGGGGRPSTRRGGSGGGDVASLGAGGGGGMQFADGYILNKRSFNGLGLGAGVGNNDAQVEYSYNDYVGSKRP